MTSPIPLLNDPNKSSLPPCKFMGFDMQQNRYAIPFWSYLFELRPPSTIVEIGTYEGGLSVPLAIMAHNYGAKFSTFNTVKEHHKYQGWFNLLGIDFRIADVFSESGTHQIRALIQRQGTTCVLCDNGNKVEEFKLFSPMLKVGDVIAGHDYYIDNAHWRASEIHIESVSRTVYECGLSEIITPPFREAAWLAYEKTT